MTVSVLGVLGRGLVEPDTPIACADDAGLTRGDGCFEGLRIRRREAGWTIDSLDRHLARMARSAAALEIPFDPARWEPFVRELGDAWSRQNPQEDEAPVKFVLTRGRPGRDPLAFATVSAFEPETARMRDEGIDVVILGRGTRADSYRDAAWLLGGVKTLSYAVNMASEREAVGRGAVQPIFVTLDGELLEAPRQSVVWCPRPGELVTVPDGGGNGILHSITTEVLLEEAERTGWTVRRNGGTVDDLRRAELVMLVSSVNGPLRVRAIDGTALPVGRSTADGLRNCRELIDF